MVEYDQITKSFQKFFDQDTLQGVLDSKVDCKAFDAVKVDKVSRQELQFQMEFVEQLHQ